MKSKKLSKLSRTSLLLFLCFGLDKVIAVLRQLIIARQFGLSPELDVFNVANNLPDMLFTLISGGALSMALIPVMTDVIHRSGKENGWKLFSSIANLAFLIAATLSVIIAVFSEPIVCSEIGIAPGFSAEQQKLVVNLMRLNLIATLIFSLSGLIMGGLQANEHFLLPALAPIFYNIGQIIGAVIMAPNQAYRIGPISLPYLGMDVYGLVGGVLLGAISHLLIQIPALIRHGFHWSPCLEINDEDVQRVLRILCPRVISVFFVQMIFIVRDNLASRLEVGSVTALSYGYMLQQLPETLIGTAIGTAILPTLSILVSDRKQNEFQNIIQKACSTAIALSLGIAAVMAFGLEPLIRFAFGMDAAQSGLLMRTLQGFLIGLVGHCLLEIANRAFYAQENATIPLVGTIINLALYIIIGALCYRRWDAPGISLTDSIAFTIQAVFILIMLHFPGKPQRLCANIHINGTLLRGLIGSAAAVWICVYIIRIPGNNLVQSILGMICGTTVYSLFILPELKQMNDL